jgi:hypothetical protein
MTKATNENESSEDEFLPDISYMSEDNTDDPFAIPREAGNTSQPFDLSPRV